MSREILFRAKKVGVNHAGDWVEGNLIINPSGHFIAKLNSVFCETWWSQDVIRVNDFTVCQYTGLKDRNGTKIFENDICTVTREDGLFLIEWDEDTARFVLNGDGLTIDFDNAYGSECEVQGNKFDNPELLEYTDENAAQYADNPTLAPAT